jgi:hypothetical protein
LNRLAGPPIGREHHEVTMGKRSTAAQSEYVTLVPGFEMDDLVSTLVVDFHGAPEGAQEASL